jgi:hypothetical protein
MVFPGLSIRGQNKTKKYWTGIQRANVEGLNDKIVPSTVGLLNF